MISFVQTSAISTGKLHGEEFTHMYLQTSDKRPNKILLLWVSWRFGTSKWAEWVTGPGVVEAGFFTWLCL